MNSFATQILGILKTLLPGGTALHEPKFSGNEWIYVKECLDTGWVSSVGKFVDKLELDLAAFCGVKKAVACVNGTAALQVCLRLAGVVPGDEVLVPALTFVATANAVAALGAIPHFADCAPDTFGIDPEKLGAYLEDVAMVSGGVCRNRITGRVIRAVVPVHVFGHPVDLDPLVALANKYALVLVEDAAESLGSYYKGRHTGGFGRLAAVSFNGNKIVTTGGGGAILTNDVSLAAFAKHITTTAKIPHRWEYRHDAIGYNFRMPNLNAALGCAQLESLPGFIAAKRALAARYREAFDGVAGVRFFSEASFARSNYWLNAIVLDRGTAALRDDILQATNDAGIMTRPPWRLLHSLKPYQDCPRMDLSCATDLENRVINLPSSAILGEAHVA